MYKPKFIIPKGLGFNSHMELGYALELAGAEIEYILLNDLIANPDILNDDCRGLGFPGGFTMADYLGAGKSVANRIEPSPFYDILKQKVNDKKFPIIFVCNSVQIAAKLDLFPVKVGTMQNKSGKHETGIWDLKVNPDTDNAWLEQVKECNEPIFAHISNGEGNIQIAPEDLDKAEEMNLIVLEYCQGYINDLYNSSRGDRFDPSGSTKHAAGLGWNKSKFAVFPHFERLIYRYQFAPYRIPGDLSLYEPSFRIFKSGVDYTKES